MSLSSHFQIYLFFIITGVWIFVCSFHFKDLPLHSKRGSDCFKGTKVTTLVPALIDKHKTTAS